MDYYKMICRAIESGEVIDLLCGAPTYEIEMSRYSSDVFPTDVNIVLVNCFYKQVDVIENIEIIFKNTIEKMIECGPMELYTAILYFDTCVYHEEKNTASFFIDKIYWANKIKCAIKDNIKDLLEYVVFPNGMRKIKPIQTIKGFNKYYEKKYGISIIE